MSDLIIPGRVIDDGPPPQLLRLAALLGVPAGALFTLDDLVELATKLQTDRIRENEISIKLVGLVQEAMLGDRTGGICYWCSAEYGHSYTCEANQLFNKEQA